MSYGEQAETEKKMIIKSTRKSNKKLNTLIKIKFQMFAKKSK